ncbi:response regulator [Maribius pontilimi]|uniref:Response regulator n=1 Tax=Palleronia pontilimi TaxID=1964209 RepID=A0A934MC94_9RHOB|nr:response regulator [Palleronia pontilimi]MBJ3762270.1 response regulator [Palleronia pontilimi]
MKMLVVDDDPAICCIWSDVLEEEGHEVDVIRDAEAARKKLMTKSYDAVVLDLCLGEESGLSVAALATYTNPECRVVIVTGTSLFARGELFCMAPNIAAVLRKPVSISELVAVLEYDAIGLTRMSA